MRIQYEATARVLFGFGMVLSVAALGRVVGISSPWFALIAAFCSLGLLDLAMPIMRVRLPRPLRPVHSWEVQNGIYRAIGVSAFGALLRGTPLRLLNQRVYFRKGARDLAAVRTHLENAEAAHFWGIFATIPYLVFACVRGWWSAWAVVLLFDVVVNIYPILHLRLVRSRIEDALNGVRSRCLPRKK